MAREGKPPAFQHYARDMLVALHGCTLEERGAVGMLREIQWEHGPRLADPAALARDLHVTTAKATKLLPALRRIFVDFPDGKLADPGLEAQRQEGEEFRAKQRAAGLASAAAKAAKAAEQASTGVDPGLPPGSNQGATGASTAPPTGGQPDGNSAIRGLHSAGTTDTESAGERALVDACRALVTSNGRAGAMGGDILAPTLAELVARAAAACDPPAEPAAYARAACDMYDRLRDSYVTGMKPAWRADAMRLHWDRIERVLAGNEEAPEAWQPKAQRPPAGGGRARVPIARNRGPVSGTGGSRP